jgi:hypothetical protein
LRTVLADPTKQSALSTDALSRARRSYSWLSVNERYERALLRLIQDRDLKGKPA